MVIIDKTDFYKRNWDGENRVRRFELEELARFYNLEFSKKNSNFEIYDIIDKYFSNTIKFKFNKKDYKFLSNFYNCEIIYKNNLFSSSEALFQYLKFVTINDLDYAKLIFENRNGLAKEVKIKSGKGVYIDYKYKEINKNGKIKTKKLIKEEIETLLKEKWDLNIKKKVMLDVLKLKFSNETLKNELLKTGNNRLEEIGRFKHDIWCHTGLNLLGNILMDIRNILKID